MITAPTALERLAISVAKGLAGPNTDMRVGIPDLFGERYQKRHFDKSMIRDAYALGSDEGDGVPYAGLINPDNATSGPYGGTSVVWIPTKEHGSIVTFVVGTKGLSPDEGILTRPGHRRRVGALRRYLARLGVHAWTKPDPAALTITVPDEVQRLFPGFEHAFRRYGQVIYCMAIVPRDDDQKAVHVFQAFLDLYAYERGWQALKAAEAEYREFIGALRADIFTRTDAQSVNDLVRSRRFVILQGPPGTGKTRMADEVRRTFFRDNGTTVQFHPAVTYEDFVVGLSPDPSDAGLRFRPRRGWLLEAAKSAKSAPFLLVIDEVNRADLGKVLGEAIYLFEAADVGGECARTVKLPHSVDGTDTFKLPENLYVLATMNTADRSIAGIDLAVRRRFAFMTMMPERQVVAKQENVPLATTMFDRLTDVFVEHAPEEAIDLLPGHSYFLAKDEQELRQRFRYELLPLLDEYLRQGFLGPATTELHAVRDAIEDAVSGNINGVQG